MDPSGKVCSEPKASSHDKQKNSNFKMDSAPDLEGSVGEVHHHRSGSSEPGLERRNPGEFVALPDLDVGAGFQQVLLHVVHEIMKQLHLFLEVGGEDGQGEVVLLALVVDVVNVPRKKKPKS